MQLKSAHPDTDIFATVMQRRQVDASNIKNNRPIELEFAPDTSTPWAQFDLFVYLVIVVDMNDIVHARIDTHTRQIMRRLQRRHGWSDSDIVRHGIRALGDTELPPGQRSKQIFGLGRFASGIKDLGNNDKHLRNFGR